MRAPRPHVWELLVATDFSPKPDRAFHAASARRLVARFHLCEVFQKCGDPAHHRRHVARVSLG